MDFQSLIEERYSVRKFTDKKVEPDKIQAILQAARHAPTANNQQPQRYYVIESDGMRKAMKNVTKCTFDAPVLILVCFDKSACWRRPFDGALSGETDASIIGTYIMLKAADLGLGAVWVAFFDPDMCRRELGLHDNIIPQAIFPIGYAAAESKPAEKHFLRKTVAELTEYL